MTRLSSCSTSLYVGERRRFYCAAFMKMHILFGVECSSQWSGVFLSVCRFSASTLEPHPSNIPSRVGAPTLVPYLDGWCVIGALRWQITELRLCVPTNSASNHLGLHRMTQHKNDTTLLDVIDSLPRWPWQAARRRSLPPLCSQGQRTFLEFVKFPSTPPSLHPVAHTPQVTRNLRKQVLIFSYLQAHKHRTKVVRLLLSWCAP